MLNLAQLKGRHTIKIIANGVLITPCARTGGEVIDLINANLVDDDYDRVVDVMVNANTIVLVFHISSKGKTKQFWVTIDEEQEDL